MNTFETVAAQLEQDIKDTVKKQYPPDRKTSEDSECLGVDVSKLGTQAEKNFRQHLGDMNPGISN